LSDKPITIIQKSKMNKPLIALLIICISLFSAKLSAQEIEVKGKIIDNSTKIPLESATVYLESIKDSTLITYTISDKKGVFELSARTKLEEVNLFVTFNGFQTYKKKIKLDKALIELPEIKM
jgi:hypothetical protein